MRIFKEFYYNLVLYWLNEQQDFNFGLMSEGLMTSDYFYKEEENLRRLILKYNTKLNELKKPGK